MKEPHSVPAYPLSFAEYLHFGSLLRLCGQRLCLTGEEFSFLLFSQGSDSELFCEDKISACSFTVLLMT